METADHHSGRSDGQYRTLFAAYGLGWHLKDINGYLQVSRHRGSYRYRDTGNNDTRTKLGIIVLTNQQATEAHDAITYTIVYGYLGINGNDRIMALKQSEQASRAEAMKITGEVWKKVEKQGASGSQQVDHSLYCGTYTDTWFGDIVISEINGKLRFNAVRSPRLRGEMLNYTGNTFIVRWDDRSMDADAFAVFSLDKHGKPQLIKMEAIRLSRISAMIFMTLTWKGKRKTDYKKSF